MDVVTIKEYLIAAAPCLNLKTRCAAVKKSVRKTNGRAGYKLRLA
ncbi:MAG: hypothetical protein WAQ28_04975 [Bacteroidia bacterium]|jgi:hypothetical protein